MDNAGALLCQRAGCSAPARFAPSLSFWAIGEPKTADRGAQMLLGLAVCREHALELELDDVICEEGWRQIVETFEAHGLASPDRASLELHLLEIHSGKDRRGLQ